MSRPNPRFHDFIGQPQVVEQLRRQLKGAQGLEEPFPHTFLLGPSGVGKTTLARAVAAEFGTSMTEVSGDVSSEELVKALQTLNHFDFLFVDEAHGMKSRLQELLFGAIDRLVVPNGAKPLDKESEQPSGEEISVKPFTLILATDRPGRLLNALHERMELTIRLDYYKSSELKEIIAVTAQRLDILVSSQAAGLLAQASGGLPRRAKHHLSLLRRRFWDQTQSKKLGLSEIRLYFDESGTTENGLGAIEHDYLRHLSDQGRASVESLALCLGLDVEFIQHQIEPLLIREKMIEITSNGRCLTEKGREQISEIVKNGDKEYD